MKEPIRLRKRTRKDGLVSLFLDVYKNGFRKNEYLGLYLYPVRTPEDRMRNAQTMEIAEQIKAQRLLALQKHDVRNWNAVRMASMALEDWLEAYDHEDIPLSKSAFMNRAKAHRWMTAFLQKNHCTRISLEDIDKDFCRSFINFLRNAESSAAHKKDDRKLHQSAIHGYVVTISAALNKAVRDGIIDKNPFRMLEKWEKVPKRDREREFLTMDEIKILMRTPIDHEEMKRAFLFSCFTGLRLSDVLKLRWDEIRESNENVMYVRTQMEKTKEYVTVPLSREAMRWLPPRRESEIVFCEVPLSRNTRNKSIRNWIKASGIKKRITFHCARHTFATMMLSLGGDLYTTSKLLGHKNVTTTEIYAKILDKKKFDTVALVDSMFQ